MKRINELKLKIEEQKMENIKLYNSIPLASKEDPNNEKAEPILKQWREGSKLLKEMIRKLQELELELKKSEIKRQSNQKTFVNGYGEATKREITSNSYNRSQKKLSREILSFMS